MAPPSVFRNVLILAVCQGLAMSCLSLAITITALIGNSLAPEPSLATVPLALQFVGTMAATIPASLFMGRYGRRTGFSLGAGFAMAAAGLSAWALFVGSFYLYCAGCLLLGFFAAHSAYYRFAAAEVSGGAFRSRAISYVMAGGLIAGFLGPELAKHTRELFSPVLFAGAYLAIAVLGFLSLLLIQFLRMPVSDAYAADAPPGRPLSRLARQPAMIVAILCAMVAYGAMNLVMVSTPLAMVACAHPFATAAFVVQWHVVGMFAPSFFTGGLIARLGVLPVIAIGALLILACVAVNLSGVEVFQFWTALAVLGVGWNFMYIGGTTLLTETYRPNERAKVQACNDFLVFSATVCTAFGSGVLYSTFGWAAVNLGVIGPVLAALAAVLWLSGRRRTAAVS